MLAEAEYGLSGQLPTSARLASRFSLRCVTTSNRILRPRPSARRRCKSASDGPFFQSEHLPKTFWIESVVQSG
jgi:hypothetical protein